jgi:hypothetical protein
MLYLWLIEFRPNDLALPRNPRRTDDLPPNLENGRLRDCAAYLNTHPKEESYDARYSKVVQRPKRLRLYPA